VASVSGTRATSRWPGRIRAKLLMAIESISALTLSVLVVSFGVGLLKH
jgi:hypothetical protein